MTQSRVVQQHSVPRDYLARWSHDGGNTVWAYRTLVPHDRYPSWEERSTRSLSAYRDLYTTALAGDESDAFERWINQHVESPAAPVLDRLTRGEPLSDADRPTLARYVAALDLRTPAAFHESMQRWERSIPDTLGRVLTRTRRALDRAARTGRALAAIDREPRTPYSPFPCRWRSMWSATPTRPAGG